MIMLIFKWKILYIGIKKAIYLTSAKFLKCLMTKLIIYEEKKQIGD